MSSAAIDYLPSSSDVASGSDPAEVGFLAPDRVHEVRSFHQSVPQYRVTPLVPLPALARDLGLGALFVKDEAPRFGLGAFKGLGGLYAMARVLAARLSVDHRPLSFPHLRQQAEGRLGDSVTFVTATAGNHGRGVAWAARQFGAGAVAIVPRGTSRERIEAIRSEGAEVEVFGRGFDDCVEEARRLASERSWALIQDTAWEGYEEIPRWVMQGYGTMVVETLEQIAAAGSDPPTHVLLQVGVGSFAAAATAALIAALGRQQPHVFTLEPRHYAPLFTSIAEGARSRVPGGATTPMSCLACTEISTLAWPILRDHCRGHFRCHDEIARTGRRALARPRPGDRSIDSGPSGAAAAGLLVELTTRDGLAELRQRVGLTPEARVLLFSTEGTPGSA